MVSDLNQYLNLAPGSKQSVYCCKQNKKTAVVFRDEDKVTFWCARCGRSECLRVRRSLNWIKNLGRKLLRPEEVSKLPPDLSETLNQKTLEWLGKYGVPAQEAVERGVRYSEMLGRAVLLVNNENKEPVCAQYRALEQGQEPKYLTTVLQGTDALYCSACYKDLFWTSPLIVLTEDILSAIKIDIVSEKRRPVCDYPGMYGYEKRRNPYTSIALLGTHLSTENAHKIASMNPSRMYLWFDNDDAGTKAAKQVRQKLELFAIDCVTV